MVRKQDENQAGSGQSTVKNQAGQQRPEQQRPEQQRTEQPVRNRVNNQGYNQNQRGSSQPRRQVSGQADGAQSLGRKEGQDHNQSQSGQGGQSLNQARNQSQPRNNTQSTRNQTDRHDGHSKEISQSKDYYRDKNRDRDNQPRQFAGASPSISKYGNSLRNRAEETIDDIKEDIGRLEKEIELEIKEIRSLKL